MSDPTAGPVGEMTLRLTLPDGAALALGRCLVGVVSIEASAPVEVNARLNLIEGDLWIEVHGPTGSARIGWPWPVDSGSRAVTLGTGETLTAAVPLLATDTSAPAFSAVGRYRLVARYAVGPGEPLASEPVAITREAGDAAATRALEHRDVLQSLLSAGTLGAASDGLAVLATSEHVPTRTLARLALGEHIEEWSPDAVRALAAVLPPHASPDDERRDAALAAVRSDAALAARLTGEPVSP
jgi:hypothetical protein